MPAKAAGGPPPEFEPETDGAVPWLFLCPSLLSVAVLVLLPFLDAVRRSFFSAMSGQFVGFKNYAAVLRNEAFRLAAANTARFVLVCIPLLLGFSLLDYLAFRCGNLCLSDLRSIPSERLFLVAESIPEDAFTRESWAQALSYLTGKTAADPRRALLSALRA